MERNAAQLAGVSAFEKFATRLRVTVFGCALHLALFSSVSAAAWAEEAYKWPNSPAGVESAAMLRAINTLDTKAIKNFAGSHLDGSSSPTDRLQFPILLENVAQRSKGLSVEAVYPQTDLYLGGFLRAKSDGKKLFFRIEVAKDNAHRIVHFEITKAAQELSSEWMKAVTKDSGLETRLQAIGEAADVQGRSGSFSGVLMIATPEKILLTRSYGLSNRDYAIPNGPETKFDIASIGKTLTAISIAQNVEGSRIDLDRAVSNYVPDYPNPVVSRQVTVRQLLSHTSGLGDFSEAKYAELRGTISTLESYYPTFSSDSLQFRPGAAWSYSNAGMLLAGIALERASGEHFPDYLRSHIFRPAGAEDCVYGRVDEVVPHRAIGYYPDDRSDPLNPLGPTLKSNVLISAVSSSPAGGEFCSAEALVHIGQALLTGKLISATAFSDFTKPGPLAPAGQSSRYGLGFESMLVNAHRVVGHSGDAPGVNTVFYLIPSKREVVVLLTNISPPFAKDFSDQVVDVLTR